VPTRPDRREHPEPATQYQYGTGEWWGAVIQAYAAMQAAMRGTGTEQNHLVHAALLKKGPAATAHLWRYVPAITLTMEEHRGAAYSYHKMKDGTVVGEGTSAFLGRGVDDYLLGLGIDVNRSLSFTHEQVSTGIEASARYWQMIGMRHAAAAVREFKREIFENPLYHRHVS
jgi:hypothetical protein